MAVKCGTSVLVVPGATAFTVMPHAPSSPLLQGARNVALMRWAEQDGHPDRPALITDALSAAFADEFA